MTTSTLINLLNSFEKQGLLNARLNQKIQDYLDYSTRSSGKLFLVLTAVIGALFVSAGVFAIISHNWDDLNQHVQGALSLVPSLVGLYIYYLAVFKHSHSVSWIEASSLFLMLMIGSSIALISQVYQMDGDFDKFVTVWLILTLPLFYIARASGIAIIYLLLSLKFLTPSIDIGIFGPSDFGYNNKYWLFWLFFLAYLPHFYFALNKNSRRQGFRSIFLGWVTAIVLIFALPLAVQGGYIWWTISMYVGFYLIGKKYYSDNFSSLGRPFQTITLYSLFGSLLIMTNDFFQEIIYRNDGIDKIGSMEPEPLTFYFLGLAAFITLTIVGIMSYKKRKDLNIFVILLPVLHVFLFGIFSLFEYLDFDIRWLGYLVLNFYILGFGIKALINGKKSNTVLLMIYGLFIITIQLWMRYFDMDIAFWLKGIFFIGVGFLFLLLHFISVDEYES